MEISQYFIELRKLFERFPGIGPRQANRFIWTLLDFDADSQKKLGQAILDLPLHMHRCAICFRVFPIKNSETVCSFCLANSSRDTSRIMVVEEDSDLLNIEKTKLFGGLYHVLGGPLDPMEERSVVRDRIKALHERVSKSPEIQKNGEIILALSPTKLGEFTSEYVKKVLEPLLGNGSDLLAGRQISKLKITRLGRGLSTGIELEYADELTIKQALDNRK